MTDWPLLSITTFLPLLGAAFVFTIRGDEAVVARNARNVALLTSIATFLVSLLAWANFNPATSDFQLVDQARWLPGFDINYKMGVDGISIFFVLLSTFLTPICILSTFEAVQKRVKEYMIAFLVLETMMVGMFCSLDLVLFYIFFEAVLIPMFIIIGVWGGQRRVYAAFKFFLYTLLGSVLMLLAILAIYFDAHTTDIQVLLTHAFPASMQTWLSQVLNGTTYSYAYDNGDKLNTITSGGSTVKNYGYDGAGRTHTVTTSAGTTTLNYDYEDRVTGITYPSSATNSFTYNGLDTRVGKVDSTGTSTYKRDGADVTDDLLSDGTIAYTPGTSERKSSTTTFDHGNYLGTFTRQTNSSQTTVATRIHDSFGDVLSTTGTPQSQFGFVGGEGYQEDGDSGLKLLGHRYYDPSTGRFLTRDPAGKGRNWFVYCDSDPTVFVDPDGYDAGGDAANKAHSRIGDGPEDCGGWMRGNFPPGACPDGPVNDWPTQMKKMPGHWEQLPNDGNVTAPGTVILTSQGTQKHGHVESIDSKGQRTSASLGSRPGKATGPVIRGKPIKDQWKKRNGKVTLWRYKG